MKTIGLADVHYSPELTLQEMCLKSLDFLIERAKVEKPDLIHFAGDLFDRAISNSEKSGFPELNKRLKALANIAPVAMIYGTVPSHDAPKCLEYLKDMKANFPITILEPGKGYILSRKNAVYLRDVYDYPYETTSEDLLVFGIPEPDKSWLLANDEELKGVDTTEEIKAVMSKFLTGLGFIRDDHLAHVPCLVLYHGSITGASLNDKQLLPPGGIEIGWEDLEQIGAQIYSCGHLHYRQKYYEGSIYPRTWGELDEKAFSIYEIEPVQIPFDNDKKAIDFNVTRKSIVFPHAPMRKNTIPPKGVAEFKPGERVWFDIQGSRQELMDFDAEKYLNEMIELGATQDSRVTVKVIKEETARAKDIINKTTLFEKVQVYAENTTIEVPEGVEDVCKELELSIKESGIALNKKRSLRLDRLELMGSKGIWKGQKKEYYVIDFESMEPGTVALLGENGSGKSTLIKQCNPYPDGLEQINNTAIKNDFFLRKSYSITYWTDDITGQRYKCKKIIDGQNKSGRSEFFLHINKDGEWIPYNAEQTGRKDPYLKAVLEIFGSPDLFKRSVYIAQKGSSMPHGATEKKELFNDLLGNSHYETMYDIAKSKYENICIEIRTTEGKISGIESSITEPEVLKSSVAEYEQQLQDEKVKLTSLEVLGSQIKTVFETLQKTVQENNEKVYILKTEKEREDKLLNKITACKDKIEEIKERSKGIPELKKSVAYQNELQEKIKIEQDKIDVIKKSNDQVESKYNQLKLAYDKDVNASSIEFEQANNLERSLDIEAERLNTKLTDNEESQKTFKENNACGNCGYIDENTTDKVLVLKVDLVSIEKSIIDNSKKLVQARLNAKSANDKFQASLESQPKKPILQFIDEKPIDDLYLQVETNGIWYMTQKIEEAAGSEERIKSLGLNIQESITEASAANEKWTVAEKEIDDTLDGKLKSKQTELDEARKEYSDVKSNVAVFENKLVSLNEDLAKQDKLIAEKDLLLSEVKTKKVKVFVWDFMQKAVGKKGVQALELDALLPSIASIANRLLEGTYGEKYTIEFDTTKEVGTGKSTAQSETLDIFIFDNQEEREELKRQKITTLSGGQEVWILKAIYDSFGIVRERNTGLKFLTSFQDEVDGALSSEQKHRYLSMIEAAHRESGRKHTVYITHDQSIQQVIKERIEI